MSALNTIGLLLLSQVMAPIKAMDLPSFHRLKLKDVFVSESYDESINTFSGKNRVPKLLCFNFENEKLVLEVNLDAHQLYNCNYDELTHDYYEGSGLIGIMLFGIPGLLLCSTLWMPFALLWLFCREVIGMNHHNILLYLKLRKHLSEEHRLALKNALKFKY